MTRSLCDTSVWLAMSIDNHVHNATVVGWFQTVNESAGAVFCRSTQQSFLRLLTTNAVFSGYGSPPLSNQRAWNTYEMLTSDERVGIEAAEPPGLEQAWRRFTERRSASPKLWMDAYLAAFALAGGLTLVTTDNAFRQFEGLDALVLGTGP
ncbi:MAG: TA system VapC family ribonuclease toxin [Tepidiformaceae bacterium]